MNERGVDNMAKAKSKTEGGLVRLYYFHDEVPEEPTAWMRFLGFLRTMRGDAITQWSTIVGETVTSMDIAARKYNQYVLNPTAREPRQWHAAATDTLEENLYVRFGSWRTNVVLVAHTDRDKNEISGEVLRVPAAPGRLPTRLPAGYSELYYAYVARDEQGSLTRCLQTVNDGRMAANSGIHAPSPSHNNYEDLWLGWTNGKPRRFVHLLVYGDFGVGKSYLAATFPKPMLVLMFDPYGKDSPYLDRGDVEAEFYMYQCNAAGCTQAGVATDVAEPKCSVCGDASGLATFVQDVREGIA